MKRVRVLNAVLCEDIRTENNGKQILIGVYLNDIRLSGPSAKFPLAMWLQMAGFDQGETEVDFRVRLDKETLGDGGIQLLINDPEEKVTVPIRPIAIDLRIDTTLHFDLKLPGSSRWKTIASLPIRLKENAN